MKVISEKKLIKIEIAYDNTSHDGRVSVLDYLDKRFGEIGYSIKRSGPKPGCNGIGLIIAHADIK